MTEYKCGHKTKGMIILDDNALSLAVYLEWAEDNNNLETKEECFDCFCKKTHKSSNKNKEVSQ